MGNSTKTAPAKHCLSNHSNLSFHLATGSQLCIGSLHLGAFNISSTKVRKETESCSIWVSIRESELLFRYSTWCSTSSRRMNRRKCVNLKRHYYQFVIKAEGHGVAVLFAQQSEPPHGFPVACTNSLTHQCTNHSVTCLWAFLMLCWALP